MRIAVCQLPDIQGDVDAAVRIIEAAVSDARRADATMVCFPECFLQGYSHDASTVRARALSTETICDAIRGAGSFDGVVVVGAFESDGDDLYNSAIVVSSGNVRGICRKRRPLSGEPITAGTTPLIIEVSGMRVGIGICSDARHADLAEAHVGTTDAVVYLLNNRLPSEVADAWRPRHLEVLADRARQVGSWVLATDVVHQDQESRSYGCTAIVDPDGAIHDRVRESSTGMLVVDVTCGAPCEAPMADQVVSRGVNPPRETCSPDR